MKLKLKLLEWYNSNKKDLPWRLNNRPYEVWISEIILQQTRVNQGLSYYLNFIEKFKTLEDLAKSSEEEVLKQWEGLGYYSRARNIHFTAKNIFFDLNNVFPNSFNTLLLLKGIGKYTAAAIASICFKEPVSAIDGNAFRVYARLFQINLDISEAKNFNHFFKIGNSVIDLKNPGNFNQAIMDLGSTICLPKNAKCIICPVNEFCGAFKNNTIYLFPVKTKKVKISNEEIYYLHLFDKENNFILRKRANNSIWANMFDFTEIAVFEKETGGKFTKEIFFLEKVNHILTHKKLKIHFYGLELDHSYLLKLTSQNANYTLAHLSKLEKHALPKPIENFFKNKLL